MGNKNMKIISVSVVFREMKIKPKCARTTPSVEMAKIKLTYNTK